MKDEKYVISMCPGGMCNRLKCLVSAMKVSKEYDRKILLYWPTNSALGCKFEQLFNLKNISQIDDNFLKNLNNRECEYYDDKRNVIPTNSKKYFILDTWRFALLQKDKLPTDWKSLNRPIPNCPSIDHEYKKIPKQIRETILENLNKIEIKKKILFKCISIAELKNTLGVHIRRGDFKSSKDKIYLASPLNMFLSKIRSEMKINKYSKIYLVTDDKEVEKVVRKNFKKVIFYEKGLIDRSSEKTVIDFLIDFENLSRCKKIIGSYDSTYSELAWWWNYRKNKEIEIIRDEKAIKNILKLRKKIEKSLISKIKKILIKLIRKKKYKFTNNYYEKS